jgi:hypothetical protein
LGPVKCKPKGDSRPPHESRGYAHDRKLKEGEAVERELLGPPQPGRETPSTATPGREGAGWNTQLKVKARLVDPKVGRAGSSDTRDYKSQNNGKAKTSRTRDRAKAKQARAITRVKARIGLPTTLQVWKDEATEKPRRIRRLVRFNRQALEASRDIA